MLWTSVGKDYDVYLFSGTGSSNNEYIDGFLKLSIDALCAHHGVDPLQPTAFAKAPLGFGR